MTLIKSSASIEVLWQLFLNGPTWDGDICSKSGRGELFEAQLASRVNGWSFLTKEGIEMALSGGYGDRKESVANRKRMVA